MQEVRSPRGNRRGVGSKEEVTVPDWLWYVFIAAACGLLYYLLSQTFKKIIRNIHETQTKVDQLMWEVRGRTDILTQHVTQIEDRLNAFPRQVVAGAGPTGGQAQPAGDAGAHKTELADFEGEMAPLRIGLEEAGANGVSCREESLARLHARTLLIPSHPAFAPHAVDGRIVLMYGVGNGNDLVELCESSQPARVIVVDRAPELLGGTRKRLAFHDPVELSLFLADDPQLWTKIGRVDHIHCTSALHFFDDLAVLLGRFRAALSAEGRIRMMLLNEESIWMNLYVGYLCRIRQGVDATLPPRVAFVRSMLGGGLFADNVTAARVSDTACTSPARVRELAQRCGLEVRQTVAMTSWRELSLLEHRQEAITSGQLTARQSGFVREVTVGDDNQPVVDGRPAGVLTVYELQPFAEEFR
jgi:hypothetical protein